MKRSIRVPAWAATLGLCAALASSVALAGGDVVFSACKNNATGVIRLLPSSLPTPLGTQCNTSATNPLLLETPISWNQTGPQGATGPQGLPGDRGPKGDTGPKGDMGAIGSTGLQGPTGDTGSTGPSGPQGAKGDTGAQGPKGDTAPSAATSLRYVISSNTLIAPGRDVYAAVSCDSAPGWTAISGGLIVEAGSRDIQMVDSHPDGDDYHGWGVTLYNTSSAYYHHFEVYAICLPPGATVETIRDAGASISVNF